MAKIYVMPDRANWSAEDLLGVGIEVEVQDADAWTFGICPRCDEKITDRGHFEDTIQAIQIHIDRGC